MAQISTATTKLIEAYSSAASASNTPGMIAPSASPAIRQSATQTER